MMPCPRALCAALCLFAYSKLYPSLKEKKSMCFSAIIMEAMGGQGGGVGAEVFCLANTSMALAMSAHTPWVQFSVSCECMLAHRTRV